jgi:hypothetical protein
MAYGVTEALNKMNELGVFSYVLPFMIIFAIIFGLLQKTKIFGPEEKAKGINAIIAVGIGLLSLMYDTVPVFFANIFPKFGVGLAVFLVLVISLGFFFINSEGKMDSKMNWIGWVIGIGVVLWALEEFQWFGGFGGGSFGFFLSEYFPAIVVLGLIIAGIVAVVGGNKKS